jgi:hypothetical protein
MLHDASLPETYWHDALMYAAHLHNVTPKRALEGITPEEAWSRNKPDVSRLCVFGAQAFVHVPDKQRTKLGAKSLTCTFLGFAQSHRAYCLVHRLSRRFLESRDVIFDKGGTETRYERIILEPAAAESGSAAEGDPPATNAVPNSKDLSDSESEQEIEGILSPASAPPTGRPK